MHACMHVQCLIACMHTCIMIYIHDILYIQTVDFDEEEITFYDSQPEVYYKTVYSSLKYITTHYSCIECMHA